MLGARDWTSALAGRRLRLALGVDLLQRPRSLPVVLHPVLGAIDRQERRLLEADPSLPLAFIGAGGLFVDDVADALTALGHRVYGLDVERLAPEESQFAVRGARPTVYLGINHLEGFAGFCEAEGLTALEWEIDPALSSVAAASGPTRRTRVFTWRKANVEEFRARGFEASYLPLATDPDHRAPMSLRPEEAAVYGAPVAFVGASMADRAATLRATFLQAWEAWRPGSSAVGVGVMDEVLAAQRLDFSTYRVPALLAARAPGWRVAPGAVVPDRVLGELAAAERRLAYVRALIPDGIRVWGDAGWEQVPGLDWRGPAGHQLELNKIYSGATINVDLGRLYQLDIITMRVFDVLACGGFVLAEHSDDLAECFQVGVEVESWRTLEELQAKVRHYLAHPGSAQAIAQRGRRAVLERHTIRARVQAMLAARPR
jgi:spore maturation protein CgeB